MSQSRIPWAITDLSGKDGGGRIYATVSVGDGQVIVLDVSYLYLEYGLNSIPRATFNCALGTNIVTGEPSKTYDAASTIRNMTPIVVQVKGDLGEWATEGKQGQKLRWPTGTDDKHGLLFSGYVVNSALKRNGQSISLQVTAVSALVDLSMTALGSANVMPGAPNEFLTDSTFVRAGNQESTNPLSLTTTLSNGSYSDFADALLASLLIAANNRSLVPNAGEVAAAQTINQRAIDVVNGASQAKWPYWQGMNKRGNQDYLKGAYKAYPLSSAFPETSRQRLISLISKQFNGSVGVSSMWDLLVGAVLPQIGMGVIPLGAGAVIAPLLPLNKNHAVEIVASEYNDMFAPTLAQRPLKAVALYGNSVSGLGLVSPATTRVGSIYPTTRMQLEDPDFKESSDGIWMFAPTPPWLDDIINGEPPEAGKESLDRQVMNRPIAVTGTATEDPTAPLQLQLVKDVPMLPGKIEEVRQTASLYAQMLYVANALRGREGVLTGKLRFDIAPGCTILVRGSTERELERNENANKLIHDTLSFVNKVTITIDAENGRASTSLVLSNIRTAHENQSKRYSMEEHPFFGKNFFENAAVAPSLNQPQTTETDANERT